VRTLVHLLIALTIGVGSLKAEFPTTPAADYNEVARRFFHGLAACCFLAATGSSQGVASSLIFTLLGALMRGACDTVPLKPEQTAPLPVWPIPQVVSDGSQKGPDAE
jgi:hypothetical protein